MEIRGFIRHKLGKEQEVFFSFLKNLVQNLFLENADNLDKKKITNLIQRHRLVPFFYKNKKSLPPWLQGYIKKQYLLNAQRILAFTNEIFVINEACKQKKINLLFLKGSALAYELFHDVSTRQMVDLDIFADKTDLKKVHSVLLELGYQPTEIPGTRLRKFSLKDNYYFHPRKKVSLEIHYRFFPNTYLHKEFIKIFPDLKKTLTIQNKEIETLNVGANLIFLVLHGANHQWFRLFWLKDLADYILKKEINWKAIIVYSRVLGIEATLVQSIYLTKIFFETSVPPEIQTIKQNNRTENYLIRQAVGAIVSPINENLFTRINRLIYLLNLSNKLLFKLNTLVGGVMRFIGK